MDLLKSKCYFRTSCQKSRMPGMVACACNPELGRLRPEDHCEFKSSLNYIETLSQNKTVFLRIWDFHARKGLFPGLR